MPRHTSSQIRSLRFDSDVRDLTVESSGVSLAVRDFGGTGDAVVLLHGLGRTLIDWSVIAPLLRVHLHTVAFDLRGHGSSGDGTWLWEEALADVAAVATEMNLGVPAVVGHSLGGMLAVMWAKSHRGAAAVNLDGHGRRTLDQYAGISHEDARRRVAEAETRVKSSLAALSGPLSPQLVEGVIAQQRRLAAQFGAPEAMFVQSIERSLRREAGAVFLRPSPVGLGAEILAAAETFDMLALYEQVTSPVLVVAGTEPDTGADPELMAAYRQGLRRDLEKAASSNPNVVVEFRAGGHGLLFDRQKTWPDASPPSSRGKQGCVMQVLGATCSNRSDICRNFE
jgi:pimeloyl-ACP methyl ester carboxylesterase